MYANPVLDADWPDPDAIRVGDDYWMIASSFNRAPGLPVLHSRDLISWTLVNHAINEVPPQGTMDSGGAESGPVRVTERETA